MTHKFTFHVSGPASEKRTMEIEAGNPFEASLKAYRALQPGEEIIDAEGADELNNWSSAFIVRVHPPSDPKRN